MRISRKTEKRFSHSGLAKICARAKNKKRDRV